MDEHNSTYRLDNLVNHLHTCCNLLWRVSSYQTVEVFFGVLCVLLGSSFTLLDTALATNADLGAAVSLHLLQTVTARSNEQTEEVNLRELFDGNVDLLGRTLGALLLVILDRGTEVRIVLHCTVDKPDTLVFQLLAVADFTGVGTATVSIIGRGRRRRSESRSEAVSKNDDKAVIDEAEAGEDTAMKAYQTALSKDLPANVKSLVQQQYSGVISSIPRAQKACARG